VVAGLGAGYGLERVERGHAILRRESGKAVAGGVMVAEWDVDKTRGGWGAGEVRSGTLRARVRGAAKIPRWLRGLAG
jgi:hypothetical protein